jgi:hypothetical protein
MARGSTGNRTVLFACDTRGSRGSGRVYIAGNSADLGSWTPNVIGLFDDGTHGDRKANDGIWSIELQLPLGMEVQYKYTRGGRPGSWEPGEEFPVRHRSFLMPAEDGFAIERSDVFGQ